MIEVRRDDGELCGYVRAGADAWSALTVFGAPMGEHDDRSDAEDDVVRNGLAVLAERWTLVDGESGAEEVVRIQHASPDAVTLALGYESYPGIPTRTIGADEVGSGRWRLVRRNGG